MQPDRANPRARALVIINVFMVVVSSVGSVVRDFLQPSWVIKR
jgi:hypothetical protein